VFDNHDAAVAALKALREAGRVHSFIAIEQRPLPGFRFNPEVSRMLRAMAQTLRENGQDDFFGDTALEEVVNAALEARFPVMNEQYLSSSIPDKSVAEAQALDLRNIGFYAQVIEGPYEHPNWAIFFGGATDFADFEQFSTRVENLDVEPTGTYNSVNCGDEPERWLSPET
jgi:hypothetical protein